MKSNFFSAQKKIGGISVSQYQERTKTVSNLLEISINIPALFSKAVKENFFKLDLNEEFFIKGIEKMKNEFHEINKTAIQAMLDSLTLAPTVIGRIADILLKTYKINFEQLDPYDLSKPLDGNPYENDNYFPSDIVMRAAAHQVDEFVKISAKYRPRVVIKQAWDPHYVEAVQLYCQMKGYTFVNKTAWRVQDISPEKLEKFTEFYSERFDKVKTIRDDYAFSSSKASQSSFFNKNVEQASDLLGKGTDLPESKAQP